MTESEAAIAPQKLEAWFIELLACPICPTHPKLRLNEAQDFLTCDSGEHGFPVVDGIPDCIPESAIPLPRPETGAADAR